MSEERKNLGIDEWLELVKEDKNLKGAYICFGQYMYLLEQENQQLKLDYELYKDNHSYKNYEVEIKDNTIKQLKDVIEEVREYLKTHKRKDEFLNLNEWQTRELLQILDKVKE